MNLARLVERANIKIMLISNEELILWFSYALAILCACALGAYVFGAIG